MAIEFRATQGGIIWVHWALIAIVIERYMMVGDGAVARRRRWEKERRESMRLILLKRGHDRWNEISPHDVICCLNWLSSEDRSKLISSINKSKWTGISFTFKDTTAQFEKMRRIEGGSLSSYGYRHTHMCVCVCVCTVVSTYEDDGYFSHHRWRHWTQREKERWNFMQIYF